VQGVFSAVNEKQKGRGILIFRGLVGVLIDPVKS